MISIKGREFNVTPEPADFWGWVAQGKYDSEWELLERFLRPEDTFLDLGAWVGSHSLFASTITKRVVAVEPDPVAFRILQRNVGDSDIAVCRHAVTGHTGFIELGSGYLGASTTRANPEAGNGIGPWEPGNLFEIECTTLREFAERLPDPLFIKIDVEGSEEQIFEDFDFFAERKPTVYLETHPFWWRREQQTWEAIGRVAALYKHVYDIKGEPIDLRSAAPKQLVLTDRA